MPGRSRKLILLAACSAALTGAAQPAPPPGAAPPPGTAAAVSPADRLFAQGQFTEAAKAYEQAVAADPTSAPALAGLARMRLYEERVDEAIELAQNALAIAPGHPVATAILSVAQARKQMFGPDIYRIEAPAGAQAIDFLVTDPLPVVRVTIGGRQGNFLLDTGGPNLTLRKPFAEALGLPLTEGGMGQFAGGLQARVERTVVPELEIGGIHIENVPAGVLATDGLQFPGMEINGVIGTGVLMHFLSTIDYCRGQLVLAPRSDSAAFQARVRAAGANVVPMWLVADHFIFARARMNQAPEGMFLVDTGLAGGGLVANKAQLDAADVTIDESNTRTGQGGGGAVTFIPFSASATLGSLTRDNIRGIYTPGGEPGAFPFTRAGIISHDFFRQSRLTFDFDAMKLVTESC